jgi:hypothetical protein
MRPRCCRLPEWQRDGARHVHRRETPSPDRLRPGLLPAGFAIQAMRVTVVGIIKPGVIIAVLPVRDAGGVSGTSRLQMNRPVQGPESAAGVHTVTRLIYRISCRTWPAGGVNTGTLPHRVTSIAGLSTRGLQPLNSKMDANYSFSGRNFYKKGGK